MDPIQALQRFVGFYRLPSVSRDWKVPRTGRPESLPYVQRNQSGSSAFGWWSLPGVDGHGPTWTPNNNRLRRLRPHTLGRQIVMAE